MADTAKSSTVAKNKYNAKAYDSLRIVVPKGEKDVIKTHAEKTDGGSINGFVNRAIKETMERDQETSKPLTGDELDALDKLPLDA